MDYLYHIKKFIKHAIMRKTKKNSRGHTLTENEMREVQGGCFFTSSDLIARCPVCGEWVIPSLYSYTLWCVNCGTKIVLEEKNEE